MHEMSSFRLLTNIDLNSRNLVQGKDWGCQPVPAPFFPKLLILGLQGFVRPASAGALTGFGPLPAFSVCSHQGQQVCEIRSELQNFCGLFFLSYPWFALFLNSYLLFIFSHSISKCIKGNLLELDITLAFSHTLIIGFKLLHIFVRSLQQDWKLPEDRACV